MTVPAYKTINSIRHAPMGKVEGRHVAEALDAIMIAFQKQTAEIAKLKVGTTNTTVNSFSSGTTSTSSSSSSTTVVDNVAMVINDYNVQTTDYQVIVVDTVANSITITLPTPSEARTVIITNYGSYEVVISAGSQLIEGQSTATIGYTNTSVTCICDGTNWSIN